MSTPPTSGPGMSTGAKVMLTLMLLICVAVIGTLIGGVASFRALQSPGTTTVVPEPSPSSVAESYAPVADDTEVTDTEEEASAVESYESASSTASASASSSATTTTRTTAPEGVTVIVSDQQPGEFRNLGVSGPTSAEFAQQVQRDYLASSDEGTVTLQSFSPVTGRTITMTCSPQGDYVLCTGGANANVYLW